MKVLVTGISGFVGPHLKRELQNAGHEVFGIDRTANNPAVSACDLSDKTQVENFLKDNTFDWIIHLAALTSVNDSWKDPDRFLKTNVGMTENIYTGLEASGTFTKVLLVSSSDVYGSQNRYPITEDMLPNPQNPYGKSKLAQEMTALSHKKLVTVISRAFNHAGPGSSAALAIPSFARQIALCEKGVQKEIKVGNLDSYRDYSDVRDVVRGYKLLVEKGEPGQAYNICSGKKRQMKEILEMLCSLSKVKINITEDPALLRPSDVPEFWGSYEKIKTQTDWKPEILFEQTLADTLAFWRKQV